MNKRVVFSVLMILVFMFSMVTVASAESKITLKIDGVEVKSTVSPIVEKGTTLVPLRIVSDSLGGLVSFDSATKQAKIETAAYTIVFTLNSKEYTVNGVKKQLAVPAKLVDSKTFIPLRVFAEAIGATVNYVPATNVATIDYFTKMTGSLKVTGSTTVQPIAQAAADKLIKMNTGLNIAVAGGGSGAGVKETIAGTTNIGMSSRKLTTDEASKIQALPIAKDGIAIIVHPSNTVKSLTKEQAEKIFLGEIKNWKDVGGDNAPILLQTRETGSGTRTTFEELLLAKKLVSSIATPHLSSAIIKQAVAKDKNAIGYDSIGFVDNTVKVVAIDNIVPSASTINADTYVMGRNLYMLVNGKPSGAAAMFMDYMRSLDCQTNIVVKEGYLTLE